MISDGACNPSGIARSLVEACDDVRIERLTPSEDAAIKLIVSQLAYIVGIWDGISPWWKGSFEEAREACKRQITETGYDELSRPDELTAEY
jgi:hypothetical protein